MDTDEGKGKPVWYLYLWGLADLLWYDDDGAPRWEHIPGVALLRRGVKWLRRLLWSLWAWEYDEAPWWIKGG